MSNVATATKFQMLVDGEWCTSATGETFTSLNPFDDTVFAQVPAATRSDVRNAIAAAAAAQPGWAAVPPGRKAELFLRAATLFEERSAEITDGLQRETGASAAMCGFQLAWVGAILRQAAGWVYEPLGRIIGSDNPGTRAYVERRPLGVIASFGPWNAATLLSWRAVVAPLVAGNAVVLKPSELSPVVSGIQIGQILMDAGFPSGVINVVTHRAEDAPEIVDEFYTNPLVRKIFFTGSAPMARRIASAAGAHLTPVVLELGGFNNTMVLSDADLDYAARATAFSAFFHQGQICMCTRRVLVHADIYDAFVKRLVDVSKTLPAGDPTSPSNLIGPLINDKAVQTALQRVNDAVGSGAELLLGGTAEGRVVVPTILASVPDTADIACDETFAPILMVERFNDLDAAITRVNSGNYGLSFSVFSENIALAESIARRIDSGAVHVNSPSLDDEPHAPNGGVKDSGWGRSGPEAIDDFSELRWMTVDDVKRPLAL